MRDCQVPFVDQPAGSLTGAAHGTAGPPGASPLDGLPDGRLARVSTETCDTNHDRALERCTG